MLRRRLPIKRWPIKRIVAQTRVVVLSDSAPRRAGFVLHQEMRLMPRNTMKKAAAEAAQAGDEFTEMPAYLAFMFSTAPELWSEMVLGGPVSSLYEEYRGFGTLGEAGDWAGEWVGRPHRLTDFWDVPGFFRAAYVEFLTGVEQEPDMSWFMEFA